MKWLNIIYFLFVTTIYSQVSIQTTYNSQIPLEVSKIVGIDNFGTQYYINKNIFYKFDGTNTTNYSNVQLGDITSINTFNPLKLVVFYQDFNTVIILDNRLAEVFKIDFNSLQPYKNVSHVSIGNDNTMWLFNQDLQQLQLYDYKLKTVRANTLPVVSNVLDITSNYNYCWLLTEKFLYKYNYFGSLLFKIKNDGYSAIKESNNNVLIQKDNKLLFISDKDDSITPIQIPDLLIKQFLVTTETLYIYDSKNLHNLQLKN